MNRLIDIERGAPQLFLDDAVIAASGGLRRTIRTPAKEYGGNLPLIAIDKEFDGLPGTFEANGSIIFDERINRWVMYALAYSQVWEKVPNRVWDSIRLYRFTSGDGYNWRPGDGKGPQCVFPRDPDDLLDRETGERARSIDLFSCWFDRTDAEYPYKGWLYFHGWGETGDGIHYMRSHDGITWERGAHVLAGTTKSERGLFKRIEARGTTLIGPGDVTVFSPDAKTGRFLAILKFYARKPLPNGNALRSRAYAWLDRIDVPWDVRQVDRVALVPAGEERDGDMPADEYYGSTAWRYGSRWIGGLKIWHGAGDYPYSAAGCAFLRLVTSRDGLDWTRVQFPNEDGHAGVWVPNGAEGHNGGYNDGGYVTEFSQGPLAMPDELLFYYGASSWGKNHEIGTRVTGGGIYRAYIRTDGFVSVDAGSLTTYPFRAEGAVLVANVAGPVGVAVVDESGEKLGETVLEYDKVAHPAYFGGKSLGEVAGTRPVSLRFDVRDGGRLYSFTVR